jgi:hypothetical protein
MASNNAETNMKAKPKSKSRHKPHSRKNTGSKKEEDQVSFTGTKAGIQKAATKTEEIKKINGGGRRRNDNNSKKVLWSIV